MLEIYVSYDLRRRGGALRKSRLPVKVSNEASRSDNDVYAHMNNHFFDSIANEYLISECGLDPAKSDVVGLVVSQSITFRKPISYPEPVLAGLAVIKLGRSSVTYSVGLWRARQVVEQTEEGLRWTLERLEEESAASTHMVHVFVSAGDRKSVVMPDRIRGGLEKLLIQEPSRL